MGPEEVWFDPDDPIPVALISSGRDRPSPGRAIGRHKADRDSNGPQKLGRGQAGGGARYSTSLISSLAWAGTQDIAHGRCAATP